MGILNKHLPAGQRAVLVGGSLVEFYTAGAYTTGDVDLVGPRDVIRRVLREAGFIESGRYFVREDVELVVEVPGPTLRKSETIAEIEFEGYRIPAVTLEDALVDRLLAAKYWRSPTDWEQAALLYGAHRDRIDEGQLLSKAKANEVEDKVRELKSLFKTP